MLRSCAACASSLQFPFPDQALREAIWRSAFPRARRELRSTTLSSRDSTSPVAAFAASRSMQRFARPNLKNLFRWRICSTRRTTKP